MNQRATGRGWRGCKPALVLLAGVVFLGGCAGMPERLVPGTLRSDIEARLGPPTAVHGLPQGTRLQYTRQPAGHQVYNLELDAAGRLLRVAQVMDAAWFDRIEIDRWTQQDVWRQFGRPAWVERVARFDGDIWTYRFLEAGLQRQAHVHLDPAGVVRRLMYSDEPLPDDAPGRDR